MSKRHRTRWLLACLTALAASRAEATDQVPSPLSTPLVAAAAAPARPDEADPDAIGFEELLLAVRVNRLPPAVTLHALRDGSGRLWIPAGIFVEWDMHPPAAALQFHGRGFRLLDGQPGLTYVLDETRLTLEIEALAHWFAGNRVASGVNEPMPAPQVDPGGFLNYDLNVTHADSDAQAAGLFEAGAFGDWGVAVSNFIVRQGYDGEDGLIRLDTTWTRDLPERRASLRFGDAIGVGGTWGRPVRFGGVQFATNFATQPGFITFPLPALHGEAALPSTLELYVNGMRRMQSEVPTGPFSIPDLPAVTGRGEVQLVVRDMLGREKVITDNFYVSSRLLRAGLHEFSYELGSERGAYGSESNDYGSLFVAGLHRMGLTDAFTVEARAEARSGQYTAGLGGALLLGRFGAVYGALAGSSSDRGQGGQFTLGFEHSSRWLGFGFNLQAANAAFSQLGLDDDDLAPRRLGQAFVSLPLRRAGSLAVSYVHRDERDEPRFQSLTASYQVSLGAIGYLSLYATRIRSETEDTMFGLSFSRPLGGRTTASTSGTFSHDSDQLLTTVQRSLPAGAGYGYRVRAGMLDRARLDAGASMQNDIGTWHVDASHADGGTGVRASASGGVAWLGGDVFLSRRMDDSFAVVRVGDFDGVKIYADNHHIATTNPDGVALLPRLRPYENNPLRIEVGDLPLDADIASTEHQAVPYFRSGIVVDFAVSRVRSAVFRLQRQNGEPVPAGSMIAAPNGERFAVGFGGESYVNGIDSGTLLTVRWNDFACTFRLVLPDTAEAVPDLGTIDCLESNP